MENNETKSFKETILGALDSFESAVNKGVDKLKEETVLEDAARKFKEILRKQLIRV